MQTHVKIKNPTVDQAEHFIKMVGLSDILGCTLIGPPGMGKTHMVENTLKELDIPYEKYGGHITLAAIYEYLFTHSDKLIFFDDCSQLIRNVEIMELLKQALSESQIKRELHYRSYGTRITAPPKFEFSGRVIMAFNVMDKRDENVKAVISRAPAIELRFSRIEILEAMKKIAQGDGGGLLEHEKVIVTREIETYTDGTMDISFRHQQQAFRIYKSCKTLYGNPPPMDKWKPLIQRLFGRREESWMREIVKSIAGEEGKMPRKELVRMISIKRSMSPRNAQRKINEYQEAGEIFINKQRDGDVSTKPFLYMLWGNN